jgi:hypothetical protein
MGKIVSAPNDETVVNVYVGGTFYFIRRTHHDKLMGIHSFFHSHLLHLPMCYGVNDSII